MIFPVVAVALSAPVTVEAAKAKPASLTTVAAPLPFVVRAIVPSTASVPMLMTPLLSSVVAARFPPTVTVPLSVMPDALPLVSVKSPSIVDAAMTSAVVPPSMVTSASVPDESLVVMVNAPVKALVVVPKAIVALSALVTRVVVPVTAKATTWVMLPVVAVILRFPPTAPSVPALMNRSPSALADVSRSTPALSTNVMFPNVSLPPVSARRLT